MFKIGNYVVYKRNVCLITEIIKDKKTSFSYYILSPLSDQSLTIEVPIENKGKFIRELIDKKEVKKIINNIPKIEIIQTLDHSIENEYKLLLNSMEHEDLIKIIKTVYKRNQERLEAGKKISEKDNNYYLKAEQLICNEFSLVLGTTYKKTQDLLIKKIQL